MILQNGCNLNWLQPFLNIFCGQCLEALATALDGDFSNSPGSHNVYSSIVVRGVQALSCCFAAIRSGRVARSRSQAS